MTYKTITILTYFLTDNVNWQVLWGKEKYLLNSSYQKQIFKTNLNSKESDPSKDKQIS